MILRVSKGNNHFRNDALSKQLNGIDSILTKDIELKFFNNITQMI